MRDKLLIIKYFGCKTMLQAVWHKLLKKTGILKKKFPICGWEEIDLEKNLATPKINLRSAIVESKRRFLSGCSVSKDDYLDFLSTAGVEPNQIVLLADKIVDKNIFPYFSSDWVRRENPIDWHINPFHNTRWPLEHWSSLDYFVPELNDIKLVWELSRFSWVYYLVRAYKITDDEKYPSFFWKLFSDWLEQNQPNLGVHWVSGQECAIRIVSWLVALFSFIDSDSTTESHIKDMLKAILVHCRRIDGFIAHAIRQKTNHSITESAGLYTVGMLFPYFKQSRYWKEKGKQILIEEGLRQIYGDGGYVQHSMNYHRVMLQAYLWCLRLAELNGGGFPGEFIGRISKSVEFLYFLQDDTGRVPNYGPNDGALILPLNSCDYLDYRPVVQLGWKCCFGKKIFPRGKWDEDVFWFYGTEVRDDSYEVIKRTSKEFPISGYYVIRAKRSWCMIRAHRYIDRPSHIDPLHIDLWIDGYNVLRDTGSYKYFIPESPALEEYFKSIFAHNTLTVDGNPIKTVSRFMLIPWPEAKCESFTVLANEIRWVGKHFTFYKNNLNVVHYREVHFTEHDNSEIWTIIDEIVSDDLSEHQVILTWNFPYNAKIKFQDEVLRILLLDRCDMEIRSNKSYTYEVIEADVKGGWESLYYNQKQPIKTLRVTVDSSLPAYIESIVKIKESDR